MDRALNDQKRQFQPGNIVKITSQRGTHAWSYSVRGNRLHLKHPDGSTRKDYTLGDGRCLVLHEGDYYLELEYCGGRF